MRTTSHSIRKVSQFPTSRGLETFCTKHKSLGVAISQSAGEAVLSIPRANKRNVSDLSCIWYLPTSHLGDAQTSPRPSTSFRLPQPPLARQVAWPAYRTLHRAQQGQVIASREIRGQTSLDKLLGTDHGPQLRYSPMGDSTFFYRGYHYQDL
jgi:hypothetical protein